MAAEENLGGKPTADLSSEEDLKPGSEKETEDSARLERIPTSPTELARSTNTADPRDPQTWPAWKRNVQILLVAFHSMVTTFIAAGIIPGYEILAEEYGVTVQMSSYLTSIQILCFGIAPFFWKPLTERYGRHHILILSIFVAMICNIAGAKCTTYGAQMAVRVIGACFISPPIAIGSGIVTELCDPEDRAQKIGWWTLMITIGTPGGPFIMGFVTHHIGVKWIFWIFTIINFFQLVAYFLVGEETLYPRTEAAQEVRNRAANDSWFRRLYPRRLDPSPITIREAVSPFELVSYPRAFIPSFAYAVVFCYANIAIIVEMPIAFGHEFHFNPQQTGLQFIAVCIGCVLGEQLSGPASDQWLKFLRKRRGHAVAADRLWLSYIGFATAYCGLLTWGFQLENAHGQWNVTPDIGAAIASFGIQVITTTLISFAVDSHKDRAIDIGLIVNVCRQIYGFTGPFYFPPMFESLGLGGAAGVFCAICAGIAMIPMIAIHFVAARNPEKSSE